MRPLLESQFIAFFFPFFLLRAEPDSPVFFPLFSPGPRVLITLRLIVRCQALFAQFPLSFVIAAYYPRFVQLLVSPLATFRGRPALDSRAV